MRIRMLRNYQGKPKGVVLDPPSIGAAKLLIQRGLAEEVQPPPQLVEVPTPNVNRASRKRR